MTANGQLVHVYSSTNSAKYVLDLSEPLPKGHLHGNKLIPLVLSPDKNSLTQIWRFEVQLFFRLCYIIIDICIIRTTD